MLEHNQNHSFVFLCAAENESKGRACCLFYLPSSGGLGTPPIGLSRKKLPNRIFLALFSSQRIHRLGYFFGTLEVNAWSASDLIFVCIVLLLNMGLKMVVTWDFWAVSHLGASQTQNSVASTGLKTFHAYMRSWIFSFESRNTTHLQYLISLVL